MGRSLDGKERKGGKKAPGVVCLLYWYAVLFPENSRSLAFRYLCLPWHPCHNLCYFSFYYLCKTIWPKQLLCTTQTCMTQTTAVCYSCTFVFSSRIACLVTVYITKLQDTASHTRGVPWKAGWLCISGRFRTQEAPSSNLPSDPCTKGIRTPVESPVTDTTKE